jgi:hypothetical protein
MSQYDATHRCHNGRDEIREPRKPTFLQGKDGLLGLPTYVDFRPGAQKTAEAASGSSGGSPSAHRPHGSPTGRRRSLRPLIAFVAGAWALILLAVWLA